MARRSRTLSKAPRRRPRADWVYRDNMWDAAGAMVNGLGTYTSQATAFNAVGMNEALGKILYDSRNFLVQMTGAIPLVGAVMGMSARAEGAKPLILAVQGDILLQTNTWVLGDALHCGFRIGVFEQDPDTGNILVDDQYSLFNATTDVQDNPARAANDQKAIWEARLFAGVGGDNNNRFRVRVRVRTRRRLTSSQCLAVYCENAGGSGIYSSVHSTVGFRLRTLVADEG